MAKPLIDDQVRAMFQAGLYRGIDLAFGLIVLAIMCVTASWSVFGHPSKEGFLTVLLGLVVVLLSWCLIVLFRVGFIVLQCRADINLMPEAAARLTLGYQRGAPQK